MKKWTSGIVAAVLAGCFAAGASATIVGQDSFDYPDGPIDLQAGGSGWTWNDTAKSDWNTMWGNANVVNAALITAGGGAKREYGGNEMDVAFRGAGIIYFGVTMTRTADTGSDNWGGMSAYDFGTERIFFGVNGGQSGTPFFGLEQSNESGAGRTLTSIPVIVGQSYRIVGALDFDNDQIHMWIDPDANDFDTPGVGTSADVTRAYTMSNWNTAVRLASGGDAPTAWDNLVVATTFAQAVPEPSSLGLLAIGALAALRRRGR